MMYQQINLYQPVLRRQPKIFSAVTLLQILAAAAVLLLGIYIHAQWKQYGLQRISASLEQQYRQLDMRLAGLQAASRSSIPAALEDEISRLQFTINERHDLLDRIDRLTIRTSPGFGSFFEALARQTLPGLWLTGVKLAEDGGAELRGITLDPKLVPRYLQKMPDQPWFKSLNQGSVHLASRQVEKPQIEFVLRSNNSGLAQ